MDKLKLKHSMNKQNYKKDLFLDCKKNKKMKLISVNLWLQHVKHNKHEDVLFDGV